MREGIESSDRVQGIAASSEDRLGQVRDDLLEILAVISHMLDDVELSSQPAMTTADRLRHNRFDIVVLGQYKQRSDRKSVV